MTGKKSNKKVNEGDEDEDDTITLTDNHKAIFWSIIKETDGGKFHKILSAGPSTNAQKTKVWKEVGEILEREIGIKMSSKKLRGLHQRQKAKLRKDHDKMVELSRTFNKECRKTGSGPGPMPPSELDGDAVDEMDINDYDPIDMPYNSLTKNVPPSFGDRGLSAGGSSSKAFLKDRPSLVGGSEIFRQPNSASTAQNVNHRPLVDGISVWKSPLNKNSTAHPKIVGLEKSRNYLPNFSSFASPNSASSNSPSSCAASPSFMSPSVTNPTEPIQSFIDIDYDGQLTVGGEDVHFYTPGLQEVTVETTPRANRFSVQTNSIRFSVQTETHFVPYSVQEERGEQKEHSQE